MSTNWKPTKYVAYSFMTLSLSILIPILAILADNTIIYVLCIVISSIVFISFSNAAHECTHELFTPWHKVNLLLGMFWMTPLLLNFVVHKNYHLQHHSHTTRKGDPEFDFEYGEFNNLKDYFKKSLSWMWCLNPLQRLNWSNAFKAMLGYKTDFLNSEKKVRQANFASIVIILWIITSLTFTYIFPIYMLVGYWIPVLFVVPYIAFYTALPEHYAVDYGKNPLKNTRTIVCSKLLSTLFWHFNFHTAHHYKPNAHFYELQKVFKHKRNECDYVESSYTSFHIKIIRQLIDR
jgi:fatty acid desaturase